MEKQRLNSRQPSPSRREFLETASVGIAAATMVTATAASPTPTPFVDGLSFLTGEDQDVVDSGLSALILDCSAAERVDTDDGSIRFTRTFDACTGSIIRTRRALRDSDNLFLATRGSEIWQAFQAGQTAIFLQFQGLEPMEGEVSKIDLFYELGLRVLQLTHHNNNAFAGGAIEKDWTGLTDLGHDAIARINDLGMVIDLSHASDRTATDALQASTKPVVLSHGGARAFVRNARCAPDSTIRGIGESGGVMGIFMMSCWLTSEDDPSVESYLNQIRHVIQVAGIDAVGIANDYTVKGQLQLAEMGNDNKKGIEGYLPWWRSVGQQGVLGFDTDPKHVVIPELNDVRRMFTIREHLEKAGFSSTEMEKILGGNWIRVLTEILG